MLQRLAELDTQFFIYLNNLGNPQWDHFWLTFTEKITHLPLMLILAVLLYRTIGIKKFLYSLIFVALLILITDQFTNLIKHSVQRPRPCRVAEIEHLMRYIAKYCSRFGYFSGHSSNSMALAVFVSFLLKPKFKYAVPILVFWAFCMGYSRIYIGVHYPGDVLSGFLTGSLFGYILYLLFGKFTERFC